MRHIHKQFYLQKYCIVTIIILGILWGSSRPIFSQTKPGGRNNEPDGDRVVLTMDAANSGSADLALFYLLLDRWFPNPAKDPGYRGAAGTHRFRLKRGESHTLWLVPVEALDPDDGTVSLSWNIWSDDLVSVNGMRTGEYSPISGSSGNLQMQQYAIQTHDALLGFLNSKMSSVKQLDPIMPDRDVRIGVIVGDTIQFNALLSPDSLVLANDDYVWSGVQSGHGDTISITFNTPGTHSEYLQVLDAPMRIGITTVMEVPFMTELEWVAEHPELAITAWQLREEAEAWMVANIAILGADLHNGRADAARHAYWNAIMTAEWSVTEAEGLATAHERVGLNNGNPHNESVMDLENNAVGRTIGSAPGITRAAIHNAVIDALHAGDLTILDDILNLDERGLLIPSNQ